MGVSMRNILLKIILFRNRISQQQELSERKIGEKVKRHKESLG